MTTHPDEIQAGPVDKVARDLTEILELYARLRAQAVHQGGHGLMPGGPAMVALGNVANQEAWENQQQATERHHAGLDGYRRAYTQADLEDPDEAWSPFQLLNFWSERWRAEHGAEYGKRPTIASEANFIRYLLGWAWDHEEAWEDFATDVRSARLKLENILTAGNRVERTRIECNRCEGKPRLIIAHRGSDPDGAEDVWKCPGCKVRLTRDETRQAFAAMLRSAGAERWLHQADAIGILRAQGRPERTVRQWLAECEAEAYCDPATHEVWVWWPSLWRKHLMTPTRKRGETA